MVKDDIVTASRITNRTTPRLYLLTIMLLAIAIMPDNVAPAFAQAPPPPGPKMQVDLAWDGLISTPGWTEVRVNLRNEGNDWTGELRIQKGSDAQLTYHQPLELPAHSNKSYRIPLFADEQSGDFKVILRDAQGQDLQQKSLTLHYKNPADVWCIIASTHNLGSDNPLTLCDERFMMPDLSRLPESAMAWENVHYIFLNGASTADMTSAQQQALLMWVAQGGQLIVSGGPTLAQSLSGLPTELQIATPAATENLTGLPSHIIANGTTLAAQLTLAAGAQPFMPNIPGFNLTAQRTIGRGAVIILSWDIVQAKSMPWLSETWGMLYPHSQSQLTKPALFTQERGNVQRLLRVPSDDLPKLWRWFIGFPLYILLMGPGTWALVRYLKRPVLTWLILPTWIVLGIIIIALELSGLFSHTFPLTQEIAYIDATAPGLPARVVQGTAIYAPRTQSLHWTNPGIPRPLAGQYNINSNNYNRGQPYPLDITLMNDHYSVNIPRSFGVMTWGTEGTTQPPYINSQLQLTLESDAPTSADAQEPVIYGQLQAPTTLRNVTLVMAQGTYNIELTKILTAGQNLAVQQAIGEYNSASSYYGYYDEPLCNPRQIFPATSGGTPSLLRHERSNPIINTGQTCYIMAEMDGVPFPSQNLTGHYIATSCVIYTVPCPTQTAGDFEINMHADSNRTTGGWIDENGEAYVEYPSTEIVYVMPAFWQIRDVEELNIRFDTPQYSNTPAPAPHATFAKIELWNWQTEQWETQAIPKPDTPLTFIDKSVLPYLENLNTVRLRLSPKDTNGTHISIEIKATGKW